MDQQKVVVILLLITIILSTFSVIITIGGGDIIKTRTVTQKETLTTNGPQAGNVNLVIAKPSGGAP